MTIVLHVTRVWGRRTCQTR